MTCAECDAPPDADAIYCATCGAPRYLAPPPQQAAWPGAIAPLTPSIYGPPAAHDMPTVQMDFAALLLDTTGAGTWHSQHAGAHPHTARGWRSSRGRLVAVVALAALLTALVSALPRLVTGARGASPVSSAAALPRACTVIPLAATRALGNVELATQLRARTPGDDRPADAVTLLTAGQQAYLSFQMHTGVEGTAQALVCMPTVLVRGTLIVPASSAGRYCQFAFRTPRGASGTGVAVLLWNGVPVARVRFSIRT